MFSYKDLIWNTHANSNSRTTLLIFYILQVIVWWKLFEKAGKEGWKSIIPVYNKWVAFNIANPGNSNNIFWFIGSFIPHVQIIVFIFMGYKFASKYTNNMIIRIMYMLFPSFTGFLLAFSDNFQYSLYDQQI